MIEIILFFGCMLVVALYARDHNTEDDSDVML